MEEPEFVGEEEEKPQGTEAGSIEKPCSLENLCRKEKRKALKKIKRKQLRKEEALKKLQEEEARLNDPEEQRRIRLMELEEEERSERERKLFEERERAWLEAMELKKKTMAEEEEEEQRRRALEEESTARQAENENELSEEDGWEYIEGPAEVIWKGDEIILKKKLIKVPKKGVEPEKSLEDAHRPTSNPLPPQSEDITDCKNAPISTRQVIDDVASQVPNFGTEQDKSHCPFHLKTGACRFGQRCSRIHFYPDKSCTLLIKNMYNGPGLAWEQDEGLEFADEEVECCYEEFYEDVHTEFLKYGEIVNFKVCKNGSFHLRGNLYVHYKSLDSAVLAYNANNGRFYAGKQVICEFVNVTRWKIAICGEFMKTRYQTCSHGTACNFIHCFRNPGGDYEWADSDKPPPRYWVKKMASLFGYLDESENEKHTELEHWDKFGKSSRSMSTDVDRYHSRRSKSRSLDHGSRRSKNSENDYRRHSRREKVHEKQQSSDKEEYEQANLKYYHRRNNRFNDADSNESADKFDERSKDRERGRRSRVRNADHDDSKNTSNETDEGWSSGDGNKYGHRHQRRKSNGHVSETFKTTGGSPSQSAISDHDTRGISSDRNKERRVSYGGKPKKRWDEVTKESNDQLKQKSKLETDYVSKKFSLRKSSSLLSDGRQEQSISDRYLERSEPMNLDKEYCNNEHIDKEGRWDPGRSYDEFEKCSESTSVMHSEAGSPVRQGERFKSDVLGRVDYYGNKVNKRNHRELKSSDSYEQRTSRRKSSRPDDDQNFSDLKYDNTNTN
ncbi:Zinc finger CCCH domain-containing protein 5, partial [Cucurbita argyrosperma subsp. sororia]